MFRFPLVFAVICSATVPAFAQNPSIVVENPWARATTPSQKVGGVFLTLTDKGPADHLTSASSPIGDMVELHQTVNEAGIMKMLPVPSLPLAQGQTIELKPGGYHLMVMGLKHGLTAGMEFPVTLNFEKSPPVTVTVKVGAAGASGAAMDHSSMDHGTMQMAPMKP